MVKHLKDALRKEMLSKRDSLSREEVEILSESIMKNLFDRPRLLEARTVGFYLSKGNEADTRKMIERSLEMKKEVLVPATNEKIEFFRFSSFADLIPGKYGILETKHRINPSKPPDLVIVPGVAFGLCMHRLGYGKGYYDLFLASSFAYRIGICYDFQVVEKLPNHENDQRMDEIITDRRVITL
jgi:5-formyltetrahydrofolate cyclo-ligase